MVFNIASQFVLLLFVLLFVSVSQSSLTTIRTGDVSRQLTEQDVAALERVLPSGAKPWLLNGDPAQIADSEFIQAYLSPTTATSTLRRGPVITVMRRISPLTEWAVQGSGTYAQVAIPGREFDQIEGDDDINRPFQVFGNFDDTELVGLVRFLRSNPPTIGGEINAIRLWPILFINRKANGSVKVLLRGAIMQGQSITVRQTDHDWAIIRVGSWIV
jgi:hypothetical protein